jgi:hypothetical protein
MMLVGNLGVEVEDNMMSLAARDFSGGSVSGAVGIKHAAEIKHVRLPFPDGGCTW